MSTSLGSPGPRQNAFAKTAVTTITAGDASDGPPFTAHAPGDIVDRELESVVYTAVKRFDPGTRRDWPEFIAWSHLTQLREVVSLDQILCPNWFHELVAEDWNHNVHENFKTHLFHDCDYVSVRTTGQPVNVLALIEDPSAAAVASFRDPRFAFCGFDLVEEQGGISALVNCGGFDKAFRPGDLSECGLLADHVKAIDVRQLLRAEYPDERMPGVVFGLSGK